MSILLINKNEPKRLHKKEEFNVPLNLVLMGSVVFGSGMFALVLFFCRECFL